MANFKRISVAAIAVAILLVTGCMASAETLAGLHIGDSRVTAIAKYGSPYDTHLDYRDKSGRTQEDLWTLADTSTLRVNSRDGKIVELYLTNATGPTGFSGINFGESTLTHFGKTTLRMIWNRFGSDGIFFSNHDSAWYGSEDSMYFSNSYELASSSQIVSFFAKITEQVKNGFIGAIWFGLS